MRYLITTLCLLVAHCNLTGQDTAAKLRITPLTGDFYIYETFSEYKGSRIPANGMYIVTKAGVVLFDSPWDTTQFQPLLDSIQQRHHSPVVMCFATHFHSDRTAGLEYYRKLGITTFTTTQTDELSKTRRMKRAEFLLKKDSVFTVGAYSFETFYPGPGHAPDNIVVWFPQQKILYGGCLVKSAEDEDLGNLGDADVKKYASSIQKVIGHCPNPAYVIPGHGDWADKRSLQHTLKMAVELGEKRGER